MERTSWSHFFAVAAAYAACYELTRHFSYSHWILPAGLRLACLLLLPYRMWPAIAFGETVPVCQNALLHAAAFGSAWAWVSAIPFVVLCMPAVRWIRSRLPLHDDEGRLNASTILIATLVCALITAVRTDAAVFAALIIEPDGMDAWRAEGLIDFLAYVLGSYLGALTLTPILLAVREWTSGPVSWSGFARSRLTRDIALGAAPVFVGLTMVASTTAGLPLDLSRLLMLLPVIVLTIRHGWHGAAVGGMLGSIALAATSSVLLDPAMIRVQAVLALVISGSLIVGMRMAPRAHRHYRTRRSTAHPSD